jgi:hypothetical protein
MTTLARPALPTSDTDETLSRCEYECTLVHVSELRALRIAGGGTNPVLGRAECRRGCCCNFRFRCFIGVVGAKRPPASTASEFV